ncbi:MAG: GerMN domain-containing protein [Lachnospiraceae bacterium]|nr:GerMN domain-containing protein [Lachnospiraceae bacterium]
MRNRIGILLCFLICLVCTGCGGESEKTASSQQGYRMYYIRSQSKLVSENFSTELTVTEDLIAEFLGALSQDSPNSVDNKRVLAENIQIIKTNYDAEKRQLALYFDSGYMEWKNQIAEILSRAAIVRTLTQIDGVDYLIFYVNDQPLMDSSGKIVGTMRASDFIEDLGGDVNDYEKTTLTLYFSNSKGDKLIEEQREVVYTTSTSMSRLVIEQLVAGPKTEGLSPVLPSDTKILNISTQEGVCYVNLDSGFMTSAVATIEVLPIYAIVNSLSELTSISKVQIAINGETNRKYREVVALDVLFERNLDLVTTLEEEQESIAAEGEQREETEGMKSKGQ